MTNVININVPPEAEELWSQSCVIRPGYWGYKVDKKNKIWRKRNFPSLIARGGFQGLANAWNSLTALQQADWDDAGSWAGMSGWDLFAVDFLYRIQNEIQGIATPNLYHQFFVGRLTVPASVQRVRLQQNYYSLPDVEVSWALNVFCDMVSEGVGSYAKLIVRVKTGYIIEETESLEIIVYEYDLTEFSTLWDYIQDSYIDGFWGSGDVSFEIDVYKMSGSLYIDGVELDYNGSNYARDFQCDHVEFNWDKLILPSSAEWKSIYPPDGIGE